MKNIDMSNIDTSEVLCYDIETQTYGSRPDAKKDKLKIFGFYSYKINKYCLIPFTDKKAIQKVIDNHKFIVGFNNENYDDPILKREGISLEYKRIIDLRKILKSRAGSMITKKGMLGNVLMKYSLDYITRFLDLVDDKSAKGEIDYSILKKNTWTKEEIKQIKEYTIRDLEVTKKLYEWIETYFEKFKDFLPKADVEKKYYLTDSMAKFGYKAICHAMKWEPIYNFNAVAPKEDEKISGGYVAFPAGEKFEGNLVQLDYSSLYPNIMVQANLYGRNKKSPEGWHGGKLFKVEGYYNDKELNDVGKLIRKWYFLRLMYKRKAILEDGTVIYYKDIEKHIGKKYYNVPEADGFFDLELLEITRERADECLKLYKEGVDLREYTIKILINLVYGILNQAYYQLVYDGVAGGDCTRLGRQFVRYARKVFREEGYPLLYSDTDSWYFEDIYNDKERYLKVKERVLKDIKASLPFPQHTFDADIDAEMKYMFFFKGKIEDKSSDKEMDEDDFINKSKGLMKKNYIYVTKDDKIVIKNLGIRKKNISALSKKIFWEHMVPKIKNGQIKFSKTEIDNLMKKLLKEDLSLAYMRKAVNDLSYYSKSMTGIQAQISKEYGAGIHFLIPNLRNIGIGKGIKYCSIEEFEKYKMGLADIDFTNFWRELNYFIKKHEYKSMFDYVGE